MDEAEPSDSDDDEMEIITQRQFREHQWSYAERYQEAMEPQMPSWMVNNCIKQFQSKGKVPYDFLDMKSIYAETPSGT